MSDERSQQGGQSIKRPVPDDNDSDSPDIEILPPTQKKRKLNSGAALLTEEAKENAQPGDCDSGGAALSTKEAKEKLCDLLQSIEQPVEVSVGGLADGVPNIPLLHVNNVGLVSLPLNVIQHSALLKQMKPSAFGHGTETTTDEQVRRSMELAANGFSVSDHFNKCMANLTNGVSKELGVDHRRVSAVPYKLILYEKDSHFAQHRDSEKEPGHFGTLIIQLPSIYSTVNNKPVLTVQHLDKEYKYFFGQDQSAASGLDAATNVYFAANYTDLNHAVNKIESGYRLVITYNLVWDCKQSVSDKPQVKKFNHLTQDIINAIFQSWNDDAAPLTLDLEHLYTQRELETSGVNALKGNDFMRINTLMEADADNSIRFCLANIEKEVSYFDVGDGDITRGSRRDSDSDDEEKYADCVWERNGIESLIIQHLWFLNGAHALQPISNMIKQNLLNAAKEELDEDGEEEWNDDTNVYEGYLGNASATRNTTYKKCILFAWKVESEFAMFVNLGGVALGAKYLNRIETVDEDKLRKVMASFDPDKDTPYVRDILCVAARSKCNVSLIAEFINNQLVKNKISINGTHASTQPSALSSRYGHNWDSDSDRSGPRYNPGNGGNSSKSKDLVDALVGLIKTFSWSDPLKQSVLRMLSVSLMRKDDVDTYISFISKIFSEIGVDVFEQIAAVIWQNLNEKLATQVDDLSTNHITALLKYVSVPHFDGQRQAAMFGIFAQLFFKLNVSAQEQSIFDQQMVSLLVKLWNNKVGTFLVQVLSNCSVGAVRSLQNYMFFVQELQNKGIGTRFVRSIYTQFWNNLVSKLGLNASGSALQRLQAQDIVEIYRYIAWNEIDTAQRDEQFEIFYRVYQQHVSPDKQKQICSQVDDVKLMEFRVAYLENKLRGGPPTVQCRFPNLTNQNEAPFAEFLKSNRMTWKKTCNSWSSIQHARNWARSYTGKGYSFSVEAIGRGRDAYVFVAKDQRLDSHYQQSRIYADDTKELDLLRSKIAQRQQQTKDDYNHAMNHMQYLV